MTTNTTTTYRIENPRAGVTLWEGVARSESEAYDLYLVDVGHATRAHAADVLGCAVGDLEGRVTIIELPAIHPEDLSSAGLTYGTLRALAEVVSHVRDDMGRDAELLSALAAIESQLVALAGPRFFGDHKPAAVAAFVARGGEHADAYERAAVATGAAAVATAAATMVERRALPSMAAPLDEIYDAAGDTRVAVHALASS